MDLGPGMAFVGGYGIDLDGNGETSEDEVRDYIVVANPGGWLLVYDTTSS